MENAAGLYDSTLSSVGSVGRMLRYRGCLLLLTARALKVRYRRSVLGFGWSLLYPLMSMAVLTMVFSRVFPAVSHYPLYVIVGVLAWGFFSLSCLQAMDAIVGSGPILRKVYVPSVVFPLSVVGANLANMLLSILVLPLIMLALDAHPGFHLLWLAAAVLVLSAFTVGMALVLSALNLFFNDVRYFFDGLLLVWFYASPIVYPSTLIPDRLVPFLWLNPFYWLLDFLRAPLYSGTAPSVLTVSISVAIAAFFLTTGWLLFSRLEKRFYLYL